MPGPGGGTGIRRGLKSPGREACGFDSRPGHRASRPFGVATGQFVGASVRIVGPVDVARGGCAGPGPGRQWGTVMHRTARTTLLTALLAAAALPLATVPA